jgi:predicted nicotinamide N-methyase
LSAYLDGFCFAKGQSRIAPLQVLQKVLFKEQLQVLELGAGCGIAGLTLGKCLPKAKVLLTDLPEAEEITKHNIWANGIRPKIIHQHRARIQYQKLDWEDPLPDKQREGEVDLVLVADCTYNPDVVPDLVKTLADLLKYNKDILVLLAMKVRHESEKVFFSLMAEKHMMIVDKLVLPLPLLGQEFEEVEVYVFAGDPNQYG